MKYKFIFIVFIFNNYLYSQSKFIIYDSITNERIQYANIWKNNLILTNSNSEGLFEIDDKDKDLNSIYKITCLGYKPIKLDLSNPKFYLSPETISLNEVVVYNRKKNKNIKQGSNKNKDVLVATNNSIKIAEIGKVFIPLDSTCLFIKEVIFNSYSSIDNATLKINFYSINSNKTPVELINNENIILNIKKGNNKNSFNLETYNLIVPKDGFMVSFQILLIKENKSFRKYNKNLFQYEPNLWINKDAKDEYTLNLSELNQWRKIPNTDLNIEIILTN